MLQRDGVVMVEMKVLVMMVMVMMILMKSSAMMMMMATISPLREGISLTDFCRRRAFLSRCFPPRRGGGVYLSAPLDLGFRGR
jgi:hypothetical protein